MPEIIHTADCIYSAMRLLLRFITTLLIVCGAAIITAKTASPESIRDSESYFNPPKGQINLDGVSLSDGDSTTMITLYLSTGYFSCCNYTINCDVTRADSSIEIEVKGIEVPQICLTALGPAIGTVQWESPPGKYLLRFHSQESVDRIEMIVTDTTDVVFHPIDISFITLWEDPIAGCTSDGGYIYKAR